MYEVSEVEPAPRALSFEKASRSIDEIVTFRIPVGAPAVRFEGGENHTVRSGVISRNVVRYADGSEEVTVTINLLTVLTPSGLLTGNWKSSSKGALGKNGSISELPAEIREAALALLSSSEPKRVDSSSLIELDENLLIGSWSYQNPQIEKRPIQDGNSFVLIDGVNDSERVILRSVEGLGSEYLIPFGPLESEEIEESLVDAGLVEAAGYSWKGQPVLKALGSLQELTGFGFSHGADLEQ